MGPTVWWEYNKEDIFFKQKSTNDGSKERQ